MILFFSGMLLGLIIGVIVLAISTVRREREVRYLKIKLERASRYISRSADEATTVAQEIRG